MGRRSRRQTLTLWANGEYVGRWTSTAKGDEERPSGQTQANVVRTLGNIDRGLARAYFERLRPLQSFATVDSEDYVRSLRSNSRIFRSGEQA